MPPAGFEPTIPASKRLQAHSLDRAARGIGIEVDEKSIFLAKQRLTVGACNLEVLLNSSEELNLCHLDNAPCLPSEDQPV